MAIGNRAAKTAADEEPVTKKEKKRWNRRVREMMTQAHRDWDWVGENQGELLKQYPGETIAVHCGRVVAHGWDEGQVISQGSQQEGCRRGELVVVSLPASEVEFAPDQI